MPRPFRAFPHTYERVEVDGQMRQPCLIYSRVVGYLQPVGQWNWGKQEEFRNRKPFTVPKTEQVTQPVQ